MHLKPGVPKASARDLSGTTGLQRIAGRQRVSGLEYPAGRQRVCSLDYRAGPRRVFGLEYLAGRHSGHGGDGTLIERHHQKNIAGSLSGALAPQRTAVMLALIAGFQMMRQMVGLAAAGEGGAEGPGQSARSLV
jgi:hypothetical protein